MRERLTCYVTATVKTDLERLALKVGDLRRGSLSRAFTACLERAFDNPDFEFEHFSGDEDQSCSLDAAPALSERLNVYQRHHGILERRRAFKRALLQGYAFYLRELGGL